MSRTGGTRQMHPSGRRWAYRTGKPGGHEAPWGPPKTHKSLRERVEEKIDVNGPIHPVLGTRCELWLGCHTAQNYGRIRVAGRTLNAAIVRWRLRFGDDSIPTGMWICHMCDQAACVAIDHLYLQEPAARQADKVDRGRSHHTAETRARCAPRSPARGDRSGARLHPESIRRGEAASCVTIDTAAVLAIRTARGRTYASLGAEFGISGGAVGMIRRGETWAHADGPRTWLGKNGSEAPRPTKPRLTPEETVALVLELLPPAERRGTRRHPEKRWTWRAIQNLAARLGVSPSMVTTTLRIGATLALAEKWRARIAAAP